MSGFFTVTDIPARRVVQYKRVASAVDGAVYIDDESVLGDAVDVMPYSAKTGIAATATGTTYEVAYLADAGSVYFSTQPVDSVVGATLTVEAKGGTSPYSYQWYKDDKQVVNVPDTQGSLTVTETGKYWCVVTDADNVQAVSTAATVTESAS